jgi:putative transposase
MNLAGREYRKYPHSIGCVSVHLCWIPKRRRAVLIGDVKNDLYRILHEVALEKGWIIKALEIAPDHVHLLVEYDTSHSIAQVVKAFKGRSSHELRTKYPHLKRMPSMWTREYFHDSTGKVSTSVIMAYINDPHHAKD